MNEKLKQLASWQGGVFSRDQAFACGYTHDQIVRRLKEGRWRRIRHGQYAEAVDRTDLPPWKCAAAEHNECVHALFNAKRSGSLVLSHQSALALHGMPLYDVALEDVHVTTARARRRALHGVRVHVARLGDADVTTVSGIATTTAARAAFEAGLSGFF